MRVIQATLTPWCHIVILDCQLTSFPKHYCNLLFLGPDSFNSQVTQGWPLTFSQRLHSTAVKTASPRTLRQNFTDARLRAKPLSNSTLSFLTLQTLITGPFFLLFYKLFLFPFHFLQMEKFRDAICFKSHERNFSEFYSSFFCFVKRGKETLIKMATVVLACP